MLLKVEKKKKNLKIQTVATTNGLTPRWQVVH